MAPRGRGGVPVTCFEGGVALAHRVEDDRDGCRDPEVVVHGRDEPFWAVLGQRLGQGFTGQLVQESGDPPEPHRRLHHGLVGELDRGAVVRGREVVAQRDWLGMFEHLVDGQRIAQRLAHLLPGRSDPEVVHPVTGECVARAARLGEFVLVVREDQIDAPAVNVELRAQIERRHRRALHMPPRTTRTPGGVPQRLPRFGGLPQSEVAGVTLAVIVQGVSGRLQIVQSLTRQLPVLGVGLHGEVDVAVHGIRPSVVDEPADEFDDLRHVPGRARLDGRRKAPECLVGAAEFALVVLGNCPPGPALGLRLRDDLVVDVGHVAAQGHGVALCAQPTG